MSSLAVTNTFSDGATITAAGFNTNYSDIVNYINNRNSGATTWDAVYTTSASATPLIVNNSTGTNDIANFRDNGTNALVIADGGASTFTATGSTSIAITANNNTSTGAIFVAQDNGSEVMRIADGGNVGFGTSSPDTLLHLSKANAESIKMQNTGASGAAFQFKIGGGGFENGKFLIYDRSGVADTVRLVIDSTGNLGLNTSSAFGTGQGAFGIANAAVAPSTTPSGGGVIYVQSGALKYIGSSGTVTTLGNA